MQQTNFKFEAIVHDDVSTDRSVEIIREYAEKYPDIIKPIFEKENQFSKGFDKLSSIMNAAGKGKYIALCEGDDYWTDPLKLQKQVDFMEAHPDYAMCFHAARIIDEIGDNRLYINCIGIENREYSADEVFINWTVPTASIMYRKEVLDFFVSTKGQERIYAGDIVTILSCASIGKIRGFSDCMSAYRIHQKGITYDVARNRYKIMHTPLHYEYIKENFPILSRRAANYKCREAYLERMKIQSKWTWRRYYDFFKAFSYMTFEEKRRLIREIVSNKLSKSK